MEEYNSVTTGNQHVYAHINSVNILKIKIGWNGDAVQDWFGNP